MADFRPVVLNGGVHQNLHGPDALVVDILKLIAGAAGPGLASFYMTPGLVLSAPESGAIESDGIHLYWTDAPGARHALDTAGGTETLAQAYNIGGVAADQTLTLKDAKGGAFIVDATDAGFTGTYAMQVKGTASGLVNFPRVGGLEVTTGSVLFGGAAANATSTLALSTSKTLASPAAGSIWDGLRIEDSTLTATMGAGNVTVTELVSSHFHQPTITTGGGAGLLTVTDAYTVRIGAPPVGAGSATLTNSWSLGVTGAVKLMSLLLVNPAAVSSGTFTGVTQVAAAHTNLTAGTEVPDTNFNLSAIKTWATGAITTQRDFIIQARTYAFAGASTVTTGATFAITGAPIAGAGPATITNRLALWVQADASQFDGIVKHANGTLGAPTITWSTDPTCGFYHSGVAGTGALLIGVNGTNKGSFTPTGLGLGGVVAPISVLVADVNDANTSLVNTTAVVVANSNTTVNNLSALMLTQAATAASLGAGLIATHTSRTGGARASNLAFWILNANAGSEVARCTENSNFIVGTNVDTTASRFKVIASKSVASAAGAVWDGIKLAADTLTITGGPGTITSLCKFLVEGPTVTSAAANVATDCYTQRIGVATFAGIGPASATRNWSLYVEGGTRFGGGQTIARTDVNAAGPYVVLATDYFLEVRYTATGAIQITLPALTGGTQLGGRIIIIKDSGYNAAAFNITVALGNGADKIENVNANYTINVSGACLWLKANTTTNNWEIV